ncbi:hypothetical protein GTP44_19460 [Duganella sp. FT50W]|uniref:Uncharacterized protein n=1 Tax=Duganella lactea TaxID=2692173 RepID=A0A6L8MR25_9BURK|nr:hypothetical protein [Duganella lactea]MYM84118.1 hypothetical protein [Duganella lactea]
MRTLPADHDDSEAPARLPPDDYCEGAADFFDLDHKMVSSSERASTLKQLAGEIDQWKKSRTYFGKPSPDSLVLVMPEGYGKSHLVIDLIKRGFKVVFCAKSHAQLDEKEFGFRHQYDLNVKRFRSKRQNFRSQLELLGIPPNDFKFAETATINPYAMPKVKQQESIRALDDLFVKHSCAHNAEDFFQEHYVEFVPDIMNPLLNDADVTLITFASFQAVTAIYKTSWWKGLGLIEKIIPANEDTGKPEKKIPFKKIAIIYDDPDRSDVDWLRQITQEELEKLKEINDRLSAIC